MSGNLQNYISDGHSYVRHKMFSNIKAGFLLTKIISNSDQQNMGGSNVMAIKLWKISFSMNGLANIVLIMTSAADN